MRDDHQFIDSRQAGFVLITSLLFLVIITLLALSGITSATLQQKMATNTEIKARHLLATNNTLSHVEGVIKVMHTKPPYAAKRHICYNPTTQSKTTGSKCPIHLYIKASTQQRAPKTWLSQTQWQYWLDNHQAQTYQPANSTQTQYRITITAPEPPGKKKTPGNGMNPQSEANQNAGDFYFKVTAHATGPANKSPAATQVVYRKRF